MKIPAFLRRFAERYPTTFAIWEAVGMGFAALRAYKMRAALTILGVVMGIMTVTGMSAIVAGLNDSMARQILSLGSSVVFIRPFVPGERLSDEEFRRRKGLTRSEIEAIRSRPAVRVLTAMEPLAVETVKYGNAKVNQTRAFGVDQNYEVVHEVWVEKGRFISETDVARASRVAVLGFAVAETLFPFVDPLDKEIMVDGRRFRVIGVVQKMGKFLFFDRDNMILVPLGAVQKRDPRFNFMVADFKPVAPEKLETAIEQARESLRRSRKLKYLNKDNFGIFGQDSFTDLYRQVTGGIYIVMIAISSIGLLVGGVGVMNIMLVSVTERTREIGVRKALGARRRDILWQFLTEAMTLTAVGGILGILIGALAAYLINTFSPFPAVIQTTWVLVALFVSLAVGLTFGLWPAAKASRLDPIEALRYE